MKNILFFCFVSFFLLACSAKNSEELYNLSSKEWYEQIIRDIQKRDLELADTHYTSMVSEHSADALLEPVLLILANAHMNDEEYKLADFYLEEYAKKFGSSKNIDFIRFLQIKAKFKAFAQPNREQALLLESIEQIKNFSESYPNTQYEPLVSTMLVKFYLADYLLNESIASLYRRTGRDSSYQIYQEKLENSVFKNIQMIKPKVSWYRQIFE